VCFDLRKGHSFELLATVTILLAMGFVAVGVSVVGCTGTASNRVASR